MKNSVSCNREHLKQIFSGVAVGLMLIVAISVTVIVLREGSDGRILFLIWMVIGFFILANLGQMFARARQNKSSGYE